MSISTLPRENYRGSWKNCNSKLRNKKRLIPSGETCRGKCFSIDIDSLRENKMARILGIENVYGFPVRGKISIEKIAKRT